MFCFMTNLFGALFKFLSVRVPFQRTSFIVPTNSQFVSKKMNLLALLWNASFFAFNSYTLYFDYELTLKHNFLPIRGLYLSKLVWLTMVGFL